jgi:hypothetical protein
VANTTLLSGAQQLLRQSDSFYRSQGHLVLAALGILLLWPLVAWRINSEKQAPT